MLLRSPSPATATGKSSTVSKPGGAAITRGSDSILYMCPGGSGEVVVPPVEEVVDTLGAGDFFHGALAHRIATLGLNGDRFPADLEFAASVVAESITSFGTRAWLT